MAARELELSWVLDRGLEYAARHLGLRRKRPWGPGRPPPSARYGLANCSTGGLGPSLATWRWAAGARVTATFGPRHVPAGRISDAGSPPCGRLGKAHPPGDFGQRLLMR